MMKSMIESNCFPTTCGTPANSVFNQTGTFPTVSNFHNNKTRMKKYNYTFMKHLYTVLGAVLLLAFGALSANAQTSAGAGDWNSATSGLPWSGGTLPASNGTVTISTAVTVNAAVVNTGFTITIASGGSLTFGASGSLSAASVSISLGGSLVMTAGGTLTITGGNAIANSGTFTTGTGTVIINPRTTYGSGTGTQSTTVKFAQTGKNIWTRPSSVTYVQAELWGAGGAGGGTNSTSRFGGGGQIGRAHV